MQQRVTEQEQAGAEIFDQICSNRFHDLTPYQTLYGNERAAMFQDFLGQLVINEKIACRVRRTHDLEHQNSEILDARSEIEHDKDYLEIHNALLAKEIPPKDKLLRMFGPFSDSADKVLTEYNESDKARKCLNPSASHIHRVAAVVHQLRLDNEHVQFYATVGLLHDSVEDLLKSAEDSHKNRYGLECYSRFLQDFIPADFRTQVLRLTNHYGLILKSAKDAIVKADVGYSIDTVRSALDNLQLTADRELKPFFEHLYVLLDELALEYADEGNAPDERFSDDELGWRCYKQYYIPHLANASHKANDYRPFEVKAVDLSDNAMGRGALELGKRIRNMEKIQSWIDHGRAVDPDWLPLLKRLDELQNQVLADAEEYIIGKITQSTAVSDFLASAVRTVKELEMVLFLPQ